VDSFDGFEFLDQFRESAVRYQLNYAQWGIALAQYRCTPAFGGYASEAQRRLILKMTDRRIWSYWRWENLWGNLRWDPDPIRRENIMYSGYLSLMLSAYTATTGDRGFDRPGSLQLQDGQRTYAYDSESVARAVHKNFADSAYGAFPREPNWVYEACNDIAFGGLVGHDQLNGTAYAADMLSRFRAALEYEFSNVDGTGISIRASRMGIAVPGVAASTISEAGGIFFISPSAHDIATRRWLIVRDLITVKRKRCVE